MKRLLRQSRYEIATDIWMSVCLGLRSKDYKRVQLRDGTGAIAKVLQLVERKITTRSPEQYREALQI